MANLIPVALRRLVEQRAKFCCEYCKIPNSAALHRHEPDHIISIQHGGLTIESNLALACLRCNRNKGPNIGSLDPITNQLHPFFNPRTQNWSEHFIFDDARIVALTAEARVTLKIFRLNDTDRMRERRILFLAGVMSDR